MNPLTLSGVHHTARPTWKLTETVNFYRNIMGLPLVHAISARGWGPADHPDFLHFFFDSGQGSTIAFFYYIGDAQPDWATPKTRYDFDATHTAWVVNSAAEIAQWKQHLEAAGVEVTPEMRHEVIESIYFRDPNGYLLEITRMLRPFVRHDADDALHTLDAAMALEKEALAGGQLFKSIDPVWQKKALSIAGDSIATVKVYVLDVDEFRPVVEAARSIPTAQIHTPKNGYWCIEAETELVFHRRSMGFKPAMWWSMLTGGYSGQIVTYTRDELRITGAEA
ncbi:VOC family protein [Pusillimonas sp. NJUB218]|uniref:VOC family protein n=1 Tax=Pusillimonas sp. NJUB218 TaxID=2023230 RepID=UPI000F4C6306|nr:VOC family protein [Pusillimonas sp. NJUB218]ROT43922.1 glyoxalase [Pusillimonas sp. NJUB218]